MKLLFFNHRCRDHTTNLRNSSLVSERGLFSVEYADSRQICLESAYSTPNKPLSDTSRTHYQNFKYT